MRALVLSGGGAKGAYQVGALKHLLGDLRIRYEIVAGVSVGAINALALAQFGHGAEDQASLLLDSMWYHLSTDRVYKGRAFGLLSALWSPSIYDTSPLRDLLTKNVDETAVSKSGKTLRMVAVDLATSSLRVWTERSDDLVSGAMASCAFPLAFPPVRSPDNSYLIDGGIRDATPLGEAIRAGATEVDVILCETEKLGQWSVQERTLSIGPRVLAIMAAEIFEDDLRIAQLHNELVAAGAGRSGKRAVKIRIMRPAHNLLENPLDFDTQKIRENMKTGYADARRAGWCP